MFFNPFSNISETKERAFSSVIMSALHFQTPRNDV